MTFSWRGLRRLVGVLGICRGWSHSSGDALSLWLSEVVLGSLLYVLFTAKIPQIIRSSGLSAHQYADDVQVCRAAGAVDAMDRLQTVLDDLHQWMQSNRSKLNPDKTQFIWLGNHCQLQKIDHQLLSARFPEVVFQDLVTDLGVTLDRELTMSTHVGNTINSGFYHLCQLRLIRRHLTDETAATLVHAFVLTRIDYCKIVLIGTTKQQQNRFQMVLNTTARLLLRIPMFGHIHIVDDHKHPSLIVCARSPHLQDMLSRLEQCCGC